jgi:inner membrane protein
MKPFVFKALSFLALLWVLWVASLMAGGVVDDRLRYREAARQALGNSQAGEQLVVGPVLQLPFEERWIEDEPVGKAEEGRFRKVERIVAGHYALMPEALDVVGRLNVTQRGYGLFKSNVYDLEATLTGSFKVPATDVILRARRDSSARFTGTAMPLLAFSEARGLRSLTLTIDGETVAVAPSTLRPGGLPAVQAAAPEGLPLRWAPGTVVPFSVKLVLTGTEAVNFLPIGTLNTVRLNANWPHPSFGGNVLPTQPQVRTDGFEAHWQLPALASEAQAVWRAALGSEKNAERGDAARVHAQAFGVRMIDPVNIYSLSDRATKYAMLFITLTLAGFALFELFKQLRLHPVQYGLVGLALVLFFLLLLSLAERVGFAWAYLASAAACIGLIGYYAAHVLQGWRRSLPLSLGLTALYGALYGLLNAEENALLSGSLMLFALLAAVMVATRKVDWFALFAQAKASRPEKRTPAAPAAPGTAAVDVQAQGAE